MQLWRQFPFYPISLLPLTQKEKVLLCACVEMMLSDKFFLFLFYAGDKVLDR